jgi:hypothetical protein
MQPGIRKVEKPCTKCKDEEEKDARILGTRSWWASHDSRRVEESPEGGRDPL